MRIAVITTHFPIREQQYRGHSSFQTLLKMTRHAEINVFCPMSRYPRWFLPKNFPYIRTDLDYQPEGVPAKYLEYPSLPVVTRPINGLVCAKYVAPFVMEWRPDLIFSYCVYPEGFAAVRLGRKLDVPVVVKAIGSDLNRIPDACTGWLVSRTLQSCSHVITVSEALRQRAIALGTVPEKIRTIVNGCDTSIFYLADRQQARAQLGLGAEDRLIVFVGWINFTKGVRELLDAVTQLSTTWPTLKLVFVGEGVLRAELEQKAAEAGLGGRVLFPGACPSSKVAQWMAAANLFCLPSYAEGCPNVVVEALASGRPVVASNVGGIPELVDADSGILVPPRDAFVLAHALNEALCRTWDEAEIARRSSRSWDQVADDVYGLCENVARDAAKRRPQTARAAEAG